MTDYPCGCESLTLLKKNTHHVPLCSLVVKYVETFYNPNFDFGRVFT